MSRGGWVSGGVEGSQGKQIGWTEKQLRGREPCDDSQQATVAARATPLDGPLLFVAEHRGRGDRSIGAPLATLCRRRRAMPMSEQTEGADADKASRQYMQQEAPQKLDPVQRDRLGAGAATRSAAHLNDHPPAVDVFARQGQDFGQTQARAVERRQQGAVLRFTAASSRAVTSSRLSTVGGWRRTFGRAICSTTQGWRSVWV